jgi:hypothetical protein
LIKEINVTEGFKSVFSNTKKLLDEQVKTDSISGLFRKSIENPETCKEINLSDHFTNIRDEFKHLSTLLENLVNNCIKYSDLNPDNQDVESYVKSIPTSDNDGTTNKEKMISIDIILSILIKTKSQRSNSLQLLMTTVMSQNGLNPRGCDILKKMFLGVNLGVMKNYLSKLEVGIIEQVRKDLEKFPISRYSLILDNMNIAKGHNMNKSEMMNLTVIIAAEIEHTDENLQSDKPSMTRNDFMKNKDDFLLPSVNCIKCVEAYMKKSIISILINRKYIIENENQDREQCASKIKKNLALCDEEFKDIDPRDSLPPGLKNSKKVTQNFNKSKVWNLPLLDKNEAQTDEMVEILDFVANFFNLLEKDEKENSTEDAKNLLQVIYIVLCICIYMYT